jgi:hypothetical protein
MKIVRRDARDKRLELNKLTYLTEDQRRQLLDEFIEEEFKKYT